MYLIVIMDDVVLHDDSLRLTHCADALCSCSVMGYAPCQPGVDTVAQHNSMD
jgi:hypothetical protein